jgi:cell division protein FtsN
MASVEGPSGLPALPGEAVRVRPASVEPYSAPPVSANPPVSAPPASAAAPVSSGTWVWNGASSAGAREQTGTAARLRPAIPETATGRHYRVQVGAYKQPRHAVEAFEKLKNAGFSPVYEKYDDYYRVVLGGLRQEDLKTVAERLGGAGFRDALLREE